MSFHLPCPSILKATHVSRFNRTTAPNLKLHTIHMGTHNPRGQPHSHRLSQSTWALTIHVRTHNPHGHSQPARALATHTGSHIPHGLSKPTGHSRSARALDLLYFPAFAGTAGQATPYSQGSAP
eukprot:scaffold109924_cov17-Tisochrysis_lutea.AAC.1